MAGYTRQSAASIINGENITAPPINAEFNTLQDAFNGTTGHAHDGTTGNGPKIDLATSVSGFLPAVNGGLGGKNNYAATTDPTVGDDTNDGYAVGSVWYNVPDDRYYVCVYNAAGAAVWLENRFINSSGDFAPHANNTKDLGHTLKRWKDLFLSGNADIDGSLNVATTTYLGGILTVNANAIFNVGTTTTISNIDVASGAIDNAAIGTTVAASGTFTTLSATTSLTAATADINGGSIDGATVGANSHSTGKFTTLESTGLATLNSVNIDGGAIDGAVIGANSAVAGSFTTISSAGQATLASVDINGGSIDGATIGANSASPITGTTITGTSLIGPVTGNLTGNSSGTHTGPVTGAVTGNLAGNVTSSGTSTFNNVTIDGTLNMNAGTSATITNLSAPTNDNDAARKVDVDNAVANLVDSAPGTLDTLNELAAALGDDPDFATTITNSIATKLPLAGGTMTGAIAMSTNKITGVGDPTAAQDVSSKAYTDQQDALQVTKSGDSMSGNLAMGSNNITGLATPTADDHAVNKSYADNILGSSTAAATSASNAATSESNASTSETNASNSAAAALASKNEAATSLETFQNQYLGAQGSAPTADPDGSALDVGDLYFDTTAGAMKVYSANGWTNAGSSVNGTTNRYSYTATAGQTVFAATYDAGYVDVFLNGVKQVIGSTKDVTATTGTSIVFNSATSVNDVVDIIGYGTFVLADHLTQAQSDARYVNLSGDTMTGNLGIGATPSNWSTFNALEMSNGVYLGSYTGGTTAGYLGTNNYFNGSNFIYKNSDFATRYQQVDGKHQWFTAPSGTAGNSISFSQAMTLDASGTVLVGQTSAGGFGSTTGIQMLADGRILSTVSGDQALALSRTSSDGPIAEFYKDGTTVGSIGTANGYMELGSSDTGIRFYTPSDAVIPANPATNSARDAAIDLGISSQRFKDLHLSGTANVNTVALGVNPTVSFQSNYLRFQTATASVPVIELLASASGNYSPRFDIFNGQGQLYSRIDAGGGTVFNEQGEDLDFRVETTNHTHALFVDATNQNVNVRGAVTTDPSNSMNIRGNIRLGADSATRGDTIRSAGGASAAYNGMVLMSNHINSQDQANSSLPSWLVDIGGSWADGTNFPPSTADGITIARRAAGGTKYSSAKYLGINSTATVINEDSQDHDFRVESDADANCLFVNAASSHIGMGQGTSPNSKLHIGQSSSGAIAIDSDINTGGTVPTPTAARRIGEIHAGANAGSGSDGGLLRLSAGGESNADQKATIDLSGYNVGDNGPTIRFWTGTSTRMHINYAGDVSIGGTGGKGKFYVNGYSNSIFYGGGGTALEATAVFRGDGATASQQDFSRVAIIPSTTYGTSELYMSARGFEAYGEYGAGIRNVWGGSDARNNELQFFTSSSSSQNQRHMNIDSYGRKIMNGSSTWGGISGGTQSGSAFNDAGDLYSSRATSSNSLHVRWFNTNGLVGNIATNGSSTLYNTSSDYRLKENVVDLTDATDRLKSIPVHRFNFVADADTTVDGFLAHEVQDIVPEAVTGVKDGMQDEEYEVTPAVFDDDGVVITEAVIGTRQVPDYQSIDQSKLVPLLTAALQEALTKIEAMEARLAALEGV